MYAHKVVEDIISTDNPIIKKIAKSRVDQIRSSVHFYLGDIRHIVDLAISSKPTGVQFFKGILGGDLRLPYPKITISLESKEGDGASKVLLILEEFDNGDSIVMDSWVYHTNEKTWGSNGVFFNVFNLLDADIESQYTITPIDKTCPVTPQEKHIKGFHYMLNSCLLLLNTKNISTIDNNPPLKLNKKRAKQGKQPVFTYKTLIVKPTSKKQKAQEDQGLWDNRIHLCRGHFKNRKTGRFWWQAQVRGKNKKGIIIKDYIIKT